MNIATKLISMVVAMMALLLCVGGVGLYAAKVNYQSLATVYRDRVECLEQLKSVSDMYDVKIEGTTDKLLHGTGEWKRALPEVNQARQVIRRKWRAYLTTFLDPREKRLVDEATPLKARADAVIDRLEKILAKEDAPALQALAISELYPAVDQLTAKLGELVDIQLVVSKENLDRSEFYYKKGKLISLLLMVVGLLASGLVSFFIIRGLVKDLGGEPQYVRNIALAVAAGDLAVPVQVAAKKRGSVLWAMGLMVERLRELISEKEIRTQQLKVITKELELKIAERTAELREKDDLLLLQSRQAAMGEMIGNIAHQWRQPLNNLGLGIQELKYACELGGYTQELLDKSTARSMELINHMSKTIDDFRNFFRPDAERVVFKMSEVVSKALSIVEDRLSDRRIVVELNVLADSTIQSYQNQFAQVILNILNNACDALAEQEVAEPRIRITVATEGDRSTLTIGDNAGGIPPGIIGKIFDPYFTTKGPQQGTGIGLFMAKSIIEKNMGGSLTVTNDAQGAQFRIEV